MTTTNTITKALADAEHFMKTGERRGNSAEYEQAMMAHAESQRRAGETAPAAFARLAREGDATVTKLWAAHDLAKAYETHPSLRQRDPRVGNLFKNADDTLAGYVASQRAAGETEAATEARLSRAGDPTYEKLYGALQEARRYAAGR